jgi:membrane associated rhomboid family serine protease
MPAVPARLKGPCTHQQGGWRVLIVPLRSEGMPKRVPVAVLLLIIVNVAVFLLQFNDPAKAEAAHRFYRQSVLYRIEPDLYQRWLQTHEPPRVLRGDLRALGAGPLSGQDREVLALALQYDGVFLNALEAGQLIDPASAQGRQWQQERAQYQSLRRRGLVDAGAFVPREHRPHTFVTSMFLHGDPMHLIGNMVFLWLAGALLEALIGLRRFMALYFAAGLASCALSWVLSPLSAIPELGASGAVSGVMGALATTYGARMIPCLFSIGLFAWRGRMQGYWLAVVWVAWEGLQWLLWPSNVNRAAHIGGLALGALAGLWFGRRESVARHTAGPGPDVAGQLRQRAQRQAAGMEYESAARTMLSVVRRTQQADDWALLWAYGRHVLNTPAGQEMRQAILAASPGTQRADVRKLLLDLQAQLRAGGRS